MNSNHIEVCLGPQAQQDNNIIIRHVHYEGDAQTYMHYEFPRDGDVLRDIRVIGAYGVMSWVRLNIAGVIVYNWRDDKAAGEVDACVGSQPHVLHIPIVVNMLAIGYHTCAIQFCLKNCLTGEQQGVAKPVEPPLVLRATYDLLGDDVRRSMTNRPFIISALSQS